MNENVDPARIEAKHQPTTAPMVAPTRPDPARSKPPKRRRLVKWLVVLTVAVVGVLAWRHYEDISPEATPDAGRAGGPPPQTIRDAVAAKGDIPLTVDALGVVTSLATVTVRTQIAGELQQVAFEEGQIVKAGDFLAQIDPRPYQATLEQAQAQLAKDTALHGQAEADLARYETLGKQNSIALQQVEDQKFLVAQDKAAMASDQAQIDAADLNLTYCHIVAPVGGRIGLRQVDQGNYVQATDPNGIVVITQIQPISVIFVVPEDNLPQIAARMKSGATLPVTAFDRANVKPLASGTLTTFDNQIDTTTGTFKLRAGFANDDEALFPNQFVNARLLVDTLRGAVVVPNAAVQLGPNGNFVYVVKDDDTVAVRNIKIGPADAGSTAISSGLAVGEKVVIDGADRLREGARVTVRNAAPAAARTPADQATPSPAAGGPGSLGSAPAQSDQAGERRREERRRQDQSAPAANPP